MWWGNTAAHVDLYDFRESVGLIKTVQELEREMQRGIPKAAIQYLAVRLRKSP